MFDITSYLMGDKSGEKRGITEATGHVVLESDAYDFTDTNHDGHVVISKTEVNNG